ncbi:DUF397 domain-containing protein [Actinomadura madurae]|uniref:DUF397 domain-containing protein n=1 Tax=Actinomadura madurae TaxID=1993 RepID=UPI0009445E8F|nr:DUF397 domain-containing protein [Actinomadura madurae]
MRSLTWRKSSYSSDGTSTQCVELAEMGGAIGVRDSKNPGGGHLIFAPKTFATLVRRIKDDM